MVRITVMLGLTAICGAFSSSRSERAPLAPSPALDTAVFAGGCFWGIEAVYEHVKGVRVSESGYSGGRFDDPSYEEVSSGRTGHAESVRVIYDPAQISYAQLLRIFFTVAHNPTQLNFQGPDHGTQYRSAIFYANDVQQREAQATVDSLTRAKAFRKPIVTQIVPLTKFFLAEGYHQDYLVHHPNEPYIVFNDQPKIAALKESFPELYR